MGGPKQREPTQREIDGILSSRDSKRLFQEAANRLIVEDDPDFRGLSPAEKKKLLEQWRRLDRIEEALNGVIKQVLDVRAGFRKRLKSVKDAVFGKGG